MDDLDDLADNARIRQSNAPFLPEHPSDQDLDHAASWIRSWLEANHQSNSWLAKRIAKSASTISQVLAGNYASDRSPVIRACFDSIEAHAKSTETKRPSGLVDITITRRMMALIQHVAASQTMGVVYAPAGLGKTLVAQAAEKMMPGAICIRVLTSDATPAGFIKRLARKINLHAQHRSWDTLPAIIDRLEGTGRLLLIDEAQQLDKRTFNVIRDIHDGAQVPIVLFGTDTPADGGQGLSGKIDDSAIGAQLLSRIPYRYNVIESLSQSGGAGPGTSKESYFGRPIVSVEEVIAVCTRGQIRLSDDAIDLLFRIANTPYLGCLRTCERLVMQAAQHPKLRSRTIKASDLTRIMRVMQGETYTRFIETHADQMRHLSATATAAAAG